ncbi:MAG: phosphatase PAP2 family protein [Acidiferrobacterales bacterium]
MKAIFYDWGGANVWLFHAINGVRGDFIDHFMWLGTVIGAHENFPYYLAMIALIGFARATRTEVDVAGAGSHPALVWLGAIAVFGLAYAIDGFLIGWLKTALNFPRPLVALPPDTVHVIGRPLYRYSLPSGHSAFAATVAASLWPVAGRRIRAGLALFVLWVGLSRVSVGAHFPADVLAGIALGLVVVLTARFIVRRTIRPGQPG